MRARNARPLPDRRQTVTLVAAVVVGLLGLLPGAAGAADPLTLVFWLALSAPACGTLVGAAGVGLLPYGIAVPAASLMALVWANAGAEYPLATPAWAACAVFGLFVIGFAVGRLSPRRAWASAGLFLLLLLLLSGPSVQGGFARDGTTWAREHPELAALLLDLSPFVFIADCAGRDWVHSQPTVYSLSGVEWFPRRPYDATLAGPGLLLVGSLFAWVASRRAFPGA